MPVSFVWLNPSDPKNLYSHELHLQFNMDQGNVRNDAAKLKKESEKARKALCKENEKKRKAEAIGGHSEITTSIAHEDEFNGQIFKIQQKYLFFIHLLLIKFLRSCIPDLSI